MADKTTKPTGLKIERNKLKFTASWSLGKGVKDHGDGQRLYTKLKMYEQSGIFTGIFGVESTTWSAAGEVTDSLIKETLRKHVISLDASKFYPNKNKKISGITIKVMGNQKKYTKKGKTINPSWSDWAEKTITINPPKTPTVEQKPAPLAEGVENKAVYKFNAKDVSDTNLYPFTRLKWESMLVKNTSTTDGSKLTWNENATGYKSGTSKSTSYEVPIGVETVSPDKNTSWTRFVRVRAEGIGGWSEWAYNYHTYSIAATPVITDETQPEQTGDGDIVINTSGSTSGSASHPIDANMFRYAIGVPRAGLLPPLNPSWTEVRTTADFRGTDNIYYEVDAKLEDDQCMWVSLGSKHDEQTSWSVPKLTHIGWLKDPTGLSVQTNWTSRKATITANNASSVEDSRLVVVFAGGTNENIVGVSDVGGGNKTITVDIPKYATEGKIAFGVYAAVGDYTNNIFKPYGDKSEITESFGAVTYFQTSERIQSVKSLKIDGREIIHNRAQYSWDIDGNVELFVTPSSSVGIIYEPRTTTTSPKPLMRSKNTLWQGGSVPQAPSNVSVQKTDVKGSVLVSWEWSWEDADSAQIAWSDNPLAWESTDEPSEYTITNLNPSHWYVSELETGKKWYFRVRLIQTNDDTQTYGAWSDMISIDLSSAPAKPVLQLSNYVITPDGMTKAYWQYVSTDDTPQLSAKICEATVTDYGIEYGEPIASTDTSRHIDLYAEDMGWNAGETHLLCVRTISGSGKPSDGWSDPVALQIAESITATITQDSLETQSIEVNPQTHEGNPITFYDNDGVLEFAKLRVDIEPTQEGTGDPSPSNVRPIHGVGEVVVTDTNGEDTQTITQVLTTTLQPIASDEEPYLMRAMPYSDATNLTENLVGGTVAWNQLANRQDGQDMARVYQPMFNLDGYVSVISGHKYLVSFVQPAGCAVYRQTGTRTGFPVTYKNYNAPSVNTRQDFLVGATDTASHDMGSLISKLETTEESYHLSNQMLFDLTAIFGTTIADYIYSLEQATAGSGVAWFKKLFPKSYYPYNAGELMSVKPSAHVTTGFNQWDEEWELGALSATGGNATSSTEIRSKNYFPVVGGQTYYLYCAVASTFNYKFYDADKNFISGAYIGRNNTLLIPNDARYMRFYMGAAYGATYKNDICINISNQSRNGTYEQYDGHTYSLPSVELRGIPKWVNGKLSYDGDILEPNGKVTRKYGIVDLGTLTWSYDNSVPRFVSYGINTIAKGSGRSWIIANIVCSKYKAVPLDGGTESIYGTGANKSIALSEGANISIKDADYTDAAAFKTAMSGVYLVYEKATATTENVSSFEANQLVSAGGTESYTDTRTVPIPVGHKSTYKTSHVYGGYVDLVSGELVVDRAVVDLGTLDWSKSASTEHGFYIPRGVAYKHSSSTYMLCDSYKFMGAVSASPYFKGDNTFTYWSPQGAYEIYFQDNRYSTADDFKAAVSGVNLVYELENPIRTTLTSRELSALVGRNTLTANGNMQIRLAEGITETECLTRLPLTVTVEGAGEGGVTILAIERDDDYHLDRPDDGELNGFEGEVVALKTLSGEQQFTVNTEDLRGNLDDDANYRIVAIAKDTYGQSDDVVKRFRVKWEHQPTMPEGTVEMVGDVAHITPSIVNGIEDGDHIDIYRLSADKPELIYSGAEFGHTYVDPYPAIGGGYRLVYVTSNGDYKLDDTFAWVDIDNDFEYDKMILDWDGDRAELYYNIDDDANWSKDFQATEYLGGSIVGDWNPAVSRSDDISAVVITLVEEDTVAAMRRLSDYAGAVHVRTIDGSSFTANVDVKRSRSHDHYGTRYGYSLKITRIDPIGTEAVPIDKYEVEES